MDFIFVLISIDDFVISALSRIQLTILKEKNNYIFNCKKWLLGCRYQNFSYKINQLVFKNTSDSIKCNLTLKEYRWLKAEINKLVKYDLIRTYAIVTKPWLVPYTHRLITALIINECTSTLRRKCVGCVSPINVKIVL